jgi:NADPH:quinone reductase-like Zn-dependent oxidoreductase
VKAVRFHQHGGPEVLTYEEAPDPAPKAGRSIVRVRACALNHLDLWQRRGIERIRIPLPHISGADVAGEVVETGERVMLQPGLSCGHCAQCLAGRDTCRRKRRGAGRHPACAPCRRRRHRHRRIGREARAG